MVDVISAYANFLTPALGVGRIKPSLYNVETAMEFAITARVRG
jgi:hypothetical protein